MSDNTSDKMLDGIKKINQEELVASRRLVLETIKEKQLPEPVAKVDGGVFSLPKNGRQMDGLFKNKSMLKSKPSPKPVEEESKIKKLRQLWSEQVKPAVHELKLIKKEIIIPEKNNQAKAEAEKIKKAAEASAAAEAEKIKQAQLERERNRQLFNQERKNRIEYRKMRRTKLKIYIKQQFGSANKFLRNKLPTYFLSSGKLFLYLLILSFFAGVFIYATTSAVILKFKIDNKISRMLSAYLPVPALINKSGVIEYYRYLDIKSALAVSYNTEAELSKQTKLKIAQDLIISDLKNKYGSVVENNQKLTLEERLANIIVFDPDINQVGISRIKKIKQFISNGGEFAVIASKYGDKIGQLTLDESNRDRLDFYQNLQTLSELEVGDIIYTSEGYYIFQLFDNQTEAKTFNYVFVKAKTLNEYINDSLINYKYLSFVE